MSRSRNILFNSCFAVNCLLIFALLFESRLVLPSWLQVAGRMHPLILHFPITLLVLYIFWSMFIEKKISEQDPAKSWGDWLLLLTSFTASLTALMGLFLSKENGYDPTALLWHKWSGIAIAMIPFVWYTYREKIKQYNWLNSSVALSSLVIILITGHLGAGITHGENFLLAPVLSEKKQPKVLLENTVVYTHMVRPILQSKCMGCHNSKKAKGELVMETEELLLKGGKNGKLWDSTAAGFGLLLSRLH